MKATKVLLTGLACAVLSTTASAQYFGQNKVQYRSFDWQIIQTEHFDVYFYPVEREAALDVARIAERSYARLSRILHHNFIERKPILLYASYSEFQETNALGGESPGEGTEGVTEFFKHRMVIPFTGSYEAMEHVIQHEMTHQFQYDVYSGGHPGGGIQTMIAVNPPGWFMEGMSEYLSLGPLDPATAMALRDAALQGHLPTIEDMTDDPNIFPYFYGHALFAYIGQRWGDEVIGEILQASRGAGIEGAFKRALGISLDELSKDWRDAVQATFLPQISDHYPARRIAEPLLTQKRSDGTLHLAPSLSPNGKDIAYFGEGNDFFIDLYLADAETGKTIRRLVKSTTSSNYESLRFIYSSGSFSPDGRYFAIAVKHKDRDDLVIFDIQKNKEAARLRIPLNGVNNPTWSPDGSQLAFTGYDGGLADLFIVNKDGSDLRRLTHDKYADLLPQWSPDGKTIAFATDRGPNTNFETLATGNYRIALYHLDSGQIEVLDHMEYGRNVNPVWAPDGRSLAFVSDRTGIANIFLYDLGDKQVYQLTDVYTGVSGITPISPALSWAKETDRLAFAYYDDGSWDVYAIDNPRSLRGRPYADKPMPPLVYAQTRPRYEMASATGDTGRIIPSLPVDTSSKSAPSSSIYRAPSGLRQSGAQPAETTKVSQPVSVKQLLDSSTLALPDTAEFSIKPYRVRFTPDYVARPTIGYERDNFGRGFFGGTAVSLSDMLGDRTMVFSAAVNGRLAEAEVLAAYINQVHRTNWAVGFTQEPYYFYEPSSSDTSGGLTHLNTNIRRFVIRDMFGTASYPFSQFTRAEFSLHTVAISDATLQIQDAYQYECDASGACAYIPVAENLNTIGGVTNAYAQPSLALAHDNALFSYVGPFSGSRWRVEVAPALGSWQFTALTADWRRYFFFRPFTLAVRGLYFGRTGRDGGRFPTFLGSTELIRGYTAGSFQSNECVSAITANSQTGCAELDQLIGSQVGVANVEIRFPLTRALVLGVLPVGFPPLEGAFFYDAGVSFNSVSQLHWTRTASESPDNVRIPLRSYGFGIRANMFGIVILRLDYTKPLNRPNNSRAYWTLSLGPTF
ncbi:MAG TPA: BamA/TamA family outer membrane protein [Gemmatimonadales bacterium]|nr:BamA/TamA family outer membrane protein [Gemmatimonadales bacterium]